MGRDLPSEPPRGRVFLCLESARCSWELHRDASRARTRDLPRLPWPFLSEDLGREAQPGEASAGVPLPRQGSRDGAGAPCAWVSPSSRQGAATPPGCRTIQAPRLLQVTGGRSRLPNAVRPLPALCVGASPSPSCHRLPAALRPAVLPCEGTSLPHSPHQRGEPPAAAPGAAASG